MDLGAQFVNVQFTGNTKILMLKEGLICPSCQSELNLYYINELFRMSDALEEMADEYYGIEEVEDYCNKIDEKVNNKVVKNPKKVNNSTTINVYDIYKKVTKNVIGQNKQIKNILSILVKNGLTNNPHFKSNIFLIGGTGNGKSETIKQIAKLLDKPYVIEDASKYTQEGYVGDSVENACAKLISEANGDILKAEHGIIIFDEIDKKTDNGDRSGVSTTSVQDSLLKMLEGVKVQTPQGSINTELITFVLIGACENAYKEREKRLKGKGTIGFSKEEEKQIKDEMKNPNFIPQDLINAGFKSEFIGRIDAIVEFNKMDEKIATKIINESEISIFNMFIKELKNINVDVVMDREKIVQEISRRAIQLNTGARGIRQIVVEMFENIYADLIVSNLNTRQKYECHIYKETVYDNTKFKLVKVKQV